MALVRHQFKLDASFSFDCWVFCTLDSEGRDIFWFKGKDIAHFLEYTKPANAIHTLVKPKWKKTWKDLAALSQEEVITLPSNWQPDAIFITEPGLYALVFRSKLELAQKFTDWIFENVIPSLRKSGQFKVEIEKRDRQILEIGNQLTNTEQEYETVKKIVETIKPDVIAKPKSETLLHTLAVHQLNDAKKNYAFSRCQRRHLPKALKRLKRENPNALELYRTNYVPNGINVLNCVKEWLKHSNVTFSSRQNLISIDDTFSEAQLIDFVKLTAPTSA